jgi:hypothetical protein
MRYLTPNSILLLLAFASIKCSAEQEHSFKFVQEDGVGTAVNKGGPRFSEELFTYEKILTLNQDPARPESFLNQPTSFTMDQRGFFFVDDTWNNRIAVFDSTGHYVKSIGKAGNGPGEFRLAHLQDLRGDVLILYDSLRRRTTRYRTDGTLLDIFTYPTTGSLANPGIPLQTVEGPWLLFKRPSEQQGDIRYSRVRVITLTAQLDTLGVIETPLVPDSFESDFSYQGEESSISLPIPFSARPVAEYVADRGLLLTTGAEPVLWWYRLDGTLAQKVTLDLAPRIVTKEEKDTRIAQVNQQIEEADSELRRNYYIATREGLVFPETKPHWNDVFVDDGEYIWLRITESPEERQLAGGGRAYYVLSPEGEYLGRTRAPATGKVVRGCLLLGFVTDPDTDDEIPTVWQLVPQAEGFKYP